MSKLRRNTLLYLEDLTAGNQFANEPAETWTRRDNPAWFSVESLSGREYMQAQQMQAAVSHRLMCEYLTGCNPRMRLTAGCDAENPTRIFHVRSVVNVNEQNRELEWMCEEAV